MGRVTKLTKLGRIESKPLEISIYKRKQNWEFFQVMYNVIEMFIVLILLFISHSSNYSIELFIRTDC